MNIYSKHESKFMNNTFLTGFIVSILACLLVYGFEITHFTLSIDEEFKNNINHTVSMGRWGHAFLKAFIFPEPFIPFFTTIISLVILSLSSAMISSTLQLKLSSAIVFSILYIGLPQFAYQLQFTNQSDTLAISILLSTSSIYLISRKKDRLRSFVIPIILICSSISIYQSIIFFPITLFIAHIILDLVRNGRRKTLLPDSLKFSCIMLLSAVLYSFITRFIQWIYGSKSDSYFFNMIGWLNSDITTAAKNTFRVIFSYLSFDAPYGINTFSLVTPLIIAILFSIVRSKNKLDLMALFVLFVLSGFAMNIIIGGFLPARAMTSLPLIFAFVGMFFCEVIKSKTIKILLPLLVLYYGSIASNALFYADYISFNRDYRISSNIIYDIEKQEGISLLKPTKIYFFGGLEMPPIDKPKNSDMFGSSFLNWDGGNSARIAAFMNTNEIANIAPVKYDSVISHKNKIYEAPTWPLDGSIMKFDDIIVVKLGNNPGSCINGVYKNIDPSRCR